MFWSSLLCVSFFILKLHLTSHSFVMLFFRLFHTSLLIPISTSLFGKLSIFLSSAFFHSLSLYIFMRVPLVFLATSWATVLCIIIIMITIIILTHRNGIKLSWIMRCYSFAMHIIYRWDRLGFSLFVVQFIFINPSSAFHIQQARRTTSGLKTVGDTRKKCSRTTKAITRRNDIRGKMKITRWKNTQTINKWSLEWNEWILSQSCSLAIFFSLFRFLSFCLKLIHFNFQFIVVRIELLVSN